MSTSKSVKEGREWKITARDGSSNLVMKRLRTHEFGVEVGRDIVVAAWN